MNLYIDSNFALELALKQEQVSAAEQLLSWAESGRLQLVCPTLCLAEPIGKLSYRRLERDALKRRLDDQSKDLGRSSQHSAGLDSITVVHAYLESLDDSESAELRHLLVRILGCCRQIPLSPAILGFASAYQKDYGLELPDATIAASICIDLNNTRMTSPAGTAIFASRDALAYEKMKLEFKSLGCKFIKRFDHAVLACEAQFRETDVDVQDKP